MVKRLFKSWVVRAMVLLVVTFTVGSYFLMRDHPIWKVSGVGFFEKYRISFDAIGFKLLGGPEMTGAYILHPDRETSFVVVTCVTDFPKEKYRHAVYYHGRLVAVGFFPYEKQYAKRKISITTLANTPQVHCWLVESVDSGEWILSRSPAHAMHFDFSSCSSLAESSLNTSPELREPIATLYRSGEWRWFLRFSDLLLTDDTARYAKMVNRYAAGNFTPKELALNHATGISKEQVQRFAAQMKRKYHL